VALHASERPALSSAAGGKKPGKAMLFLQNNLSLQCLKAEFVRTNYRSI